MTFYARKKLINFKAIREKIDIINLILNIYTISNLKETQSLEEITINIINENWGNRIIIYEDLTQQIQSFHTPFILKKVGDNYIIKLEKGFFLDPIDDLVISFLKTIFNNFDNSYCDFNQFFDDFLLNYDAMISDKMKENMYWNLVLYILSFEPGYFRYDFDETHENGLIHPVNHFDINYDSMGTYKLGLSNRISIDYIQQLIDETQPCKFLKT